MSTGEAAGVDGPGPLDDGHPTRNVAAAADGSPPLPCLESRPAEDGKILCVEMQSQSNGRQIECPRGVSVPKIAMGLPYIEHDGTKTDVWRGQFAFLSLGPGAILCHVGRFASLVALTLLNHPCMVVFRGKSVDL